MTIQEIELIPSVWEPHWGTREALRQLPQTVKEIFLKESDERIWNIIERRFGLDERPILTLEDLGIAYGLSRERIRQLEAKGLSFLRGIFLDANFARKNYRVRQETLDVVQSCRHVICESVDTGVLPTTVRSLLVSELDINQGDVSRVFEFLLGLCGIRKLNIQIAGFEPILYGSKGSLPTKTENIIKTIHNHLISQPTPVSAIDILIEVNKKRGRKDSIQPDQLRRMIELCSSAEMAEGGEHQAKFEYLGRAEQFERVLIEHGKPMSISDIQRTMNQHILHTGGRPINERNVANQISSDDRFSPIGRSGDWALTRWNIDTSSILELMKQFLMSQGAPATVAEITTYVQMKRPAADGSIPLYLQSDPSFAQASRTTWGLSEWKEVRTAKTWDPEQVGEFVEGYFRERKLDRVYYTTLKRALMEESGESEPSSRGLLNSNPAIQTEVNKDQSRTAIFQPNWRETLRVEGAGPKRRKKTLFEEISEDARLTLESVPSMEMGLKELIGVLILKYGHRYKRPYYSLHSYISLMDFVEKSPIEGTNLVLCRLVNTKLNN